LVSSCWRLRLCELPTCACCLDSARQHIQERSAQKHCQVSTLSLSDSGLHCTVSGPADRTQTQKINLLTLSWSSPSPRLAAQVCTHVAAVECCWAMCMGCSSPVCEAGPCWLALHGASKYDGAETDKVGVRSILGGKDWVDTVAQHNHHSTAPSASILQHSQLLSPESGWHLTL
jgi:hypothetical protein